MSDLMEIRRELAKSKRDGQMSERLAEMAVEIGKRYLGRFCRERSAEAYQDAYMSQFAMRLMRKWADVSEENPIAYLRSMAHFAAKDVQRKEHRHVRKLEMFSEVVRRFEDQFKEMD